MFTFDNKPKPGERERAIPKTQNIDTENDVNQISQSESPRETDKYDEFAEQHFHLYENTINEMVLKNQNEKISRLEREFSSKKKDLDEMIEREQNPSIKNDLEKIRASEYSVDEIQNFIKNHKDCRYNKYNRIRCMYYNINDLKEYEDFSFREKELEEGISKLKLDENIKNSFAKNFITLRKDLKFLFPDFPEEEAWRLLMDGERQEKGALSFDIGEPGYMAALMKAFCYMLENLGKRMDESFYYDLNKLAVNGVHDRRLEEPMIEGYLRKFTTSDLSDTDTGILMKSIEYYTKKENISLDKVVVACLNPNLAGLIGFRIEPANGSYKGVCEYECKKNSPLASERMIYANTGFDGDNVKNPEYFEKKMHLTCYNSIRRTPEYYKKVINTIFSDYYGRIDRLKEYKFSLETAGKYNRKNKYKYKRKLLEIIVSTCQNLDQLHAFLDGNIRTVAFLVLNKMLIENDMKSLDEIIKEVVDGQEVFESYKKEVEHKKSAK